MKDINDVNQELKTERRKFGTYKPYFFPVYDANVNIRSSFSFILDAEIEALKNQVDVANRSGEKAKVSFY